MDPKHSIIKGLPNVEKLRPVQICPFIMKQKWHTINFLNFRTPQKFVVITLKFDSMWLYYSIMSPNDVDGMANCADPDQTAPLISVCTVCPGISFRKRRIITVGLFMLPLCWNILPKLFSWQIGVKCHLWQLNEQHVIFLSTFLSYKPAQREHLCDIDLWPWPLF